MRGSFAASLAACLVAAAPAAAQLTPAVATSPAPSPVPAGGAPACTGGTCQIQVTPEQLLARADTLVRQRRFADAAPLIEALAQAPQTRLPSRFLAGFSAAEQGNHKLAADIFKSILADDPNQVRVRLELARSMLFLGQTASADRQFRIAQQDGDLPPDIARMIRGARDVIRSQRLWRLDVDFGFAPDSNINNATGVDTVNIRLGDMTLPISLDENAQARSGTGQFATINAGARLPVSGKAALLVDLTGAGTNYAGAAFDDYLIQGAVGPQLHLSEKLSVSAQAVGAQRWYGGSSASGQFGARLGAQLALDDRTRVGLQLDGRRTIAQFDASFSGWQVGLYANGEHALSRTVVASAGLFARREALVSAPYSNFELGGSLGLAGELPLGINFGLNGSLSRAAYDAPMELFSADARKDWRLSGVVTLGNRKLRFMGFSPSVQLSYSDNASSLAYFKSDRLRLRFALARYF